ncbi:MAG: RNA-directed DNA polymerase [Cyclobacteriaceae bacterium]|nr:RNA-directed DNA polymerase [Cyclobacteriaceae bacterium]
MLDQSFSLDNFKIIFEIENRKGNFESEFYSEEFHRLSSELKRKRREIKDYKSRGVISDDDDSLENLYNEKEGIEENKNEELEITLHGLVETVNSKGFKFNFYKFHHEDSGKDVFPVKKDAASFYTMKQLQYNINRTFGVKQSNRYLITKQVQRLLKDNFPKIVLRTDIKGFYESVSQEKLLNQINDNQLLSPKSKALIKNLFYSYNELTDQLEKPLSERKGIPRGAGVSAYLSELFMREIDNQIKRIDNVYYYGRYVDDIIIFFVPNWKMNINDYKNIINKIIESVKLKMNLSKTFPYDLEKNISLMNIEFLGYVFEMKELKYSRTYLSKNKKEKYASRIEKIFDVFKKQLNFAPKEAYKLLIHRINYLTKNTRLHKPKKGLVGIYYSNSLIENDCEDLVFLDNELHRIIDEKLPVLSFSNLNEKLKTYSFKDGFINKRFFNINSKKKHIADLRPEVLKEAKKLHNNFERIISIWK